MGLAKKKKKTKAKGAWVNTAALNKLAQSINLTRPKSLQRLKPK